MTTDKITLTVVRDAAFLRDVVRTRSVSGTVWTIADFFNRLKFFALASDQRVQTAVKCSDEAVQVLASIWLAQSGQMPTMASAYCQIQSALKHGKTTANEVLAAFSDAHDSQALRIKRALTELSQIDDMVGRFRITDSTDLLAQALLLIRNARKLPPIFERIHEINVVHLYDLTDLELDSMLALAEQGISFRFILPIDDSNKGLAQPASYIAGQIEARHDLANVDIEFLPIEGNSDLSPWIRDVRFGSSGSAQSVSDAALSAVHVRLANDVASEMQWVGETIAGLRRRNQKDGRDVPRIAVAFRSLDLRAEFLRDCLRTRHIPFRERRSGKTLADTLCAKLLLKAIEARVQAIPRSHLLAMLAHPNFRHRCTLTELAIIEKLMKMASIKSDREDDSQPEGAYLRRLDRLKLAKANDATIIKQIEEVQEVVKATLEAVKAFANDASFAKHFLATQNFVKRNIESDPSAPDADVLKALDSQKLWLDSRMHDSDKPMSLATWLRWLKQFLAARPLAGTPSEDDDAIEICTLNEIFGRTFDYVVVPDLVHGRLPRAPETNLLIKDEDRFRINQMMKRSVLRLYEEDPLVATSVPTRQALEPMLFVGALATAKKGIILSASRMDENGREQARSDFFDAALRALGHDPDHFAGSQSALVLQKESVAPDLEQTKKLERFAMIAKQRASFFARAKDVPVIAAAQPYAFHFGRDKVRQRFGPRLGLEPHHPLAPTRIEALAQCRMKGFVERFVGVDLDDEVGQGMEVRALGRLSHEVLEQFFKERRDTGVAPNELTQENRQRLLEILRVKSKPYLDGASTGHLGALRATVRWLGHTLMRLVNSLVRHPSVDGVAPVHFEVTIGLGTSSAAQQVLNVPLQVGDEKIYLGGVIDRVDEGPLRRCVVDYKISTSARLADKLREKEILRTHFQLPIYLRLLESLSPSHPDTELLAYLISIRDGEASIVLGRDRFKDLRERVLNDAHPEGLASAIDRVLAPVLSGVIPADVDVNCDECQLRGVCRINTH